MAPILFFMTKYSSLNFTLSLILLFGTLIRLKFHQGDKISKLIFEPLSHSVSLSSSYVRHTKQSYGVLGQLYSPATNPRFGPSQNDLQYEVNRDHAAIYWEANTLPAPAAVHWASFGRWIGCCYLTMLAMIARMTGYRGDKYTSVTQSSAHLGIWKDERLIKLPEKKTDD